MRRRWLGLTLLHAGCLLEDAAPARPLSDESVIAIVADPAEASPGERVHFRAVVAAPTGPVAAAPARWSFCRTPRSLVENGAVSARCAESAEAPLSDTGLSLDAIVPKDACARFGPETSAGQRPQDPDPSGGYYQPLRMVLGAQVAILRQRVRCALADAPLDVSQAFAQHYQPNQAPQSAALEADGASEGALSVHARVTLELRLAADAEETYLAYDPAHSRLVPRTETLSVSWRVSGGTLDDTESSSVDLAAETHWQLPARSGPAYVWAVARDERGGVSVTTARFEIMSSAAE